MRVRRWLAAACVTVLVGCAPQNPEIGHTQFDVADMLPSASSSPEWAVDGELELYSPDTLYEYNNGAAPLYLSYGFKKLAHLRYARGGDPLKSVTLDLYDMGSRLGAYGLYTSARPRDISLRAWGAEGYRSGVVAAAWKQNVYVHAVADADTPPLLEMAEKLVAEVAAAVPGDDARPATLDALPADGLVAHSDQYVAKDLLGHSFLPGGFIATYETAGEEGLLFLSDLGSAQAARQALASLQEYEDEHGQVLEQHDGIGDGGFWADDPGLGLALVATSGRHVVGMTSLSSRPDAERVVRQLVAALE